ncbi:S-adenosyl-L-methionine-dependent methyltransferase [Syncephalis plumigaleata]|nr:S-adenosyl-L-methionine-dependent methyltransferase [Syncephalis plumigaleata]
MTNQELIQQFPGTNKEDRVARYVFEHAKQGDPDSVYRAIDRFAHEDEWLMTMGDKKSMLIDDLIARHQPAVMIELGAYCGYKIIKYNSKAKYYSFEISPHFAEITRAMVDYAGLSDVVEVIVGPFADTIDQFLASHSEVKQIDLVFIDHDKSAYVPDLKSIEERQLLKQGAVIAADNILFPGAPEYYAYVSDNSDYTTTLEKFVILNKHEDGVAVSIKN